MIRFSPQNVLVTKRALHCKVREERHIPGDRRRGDQEERPLGTAGK